MTNLNSIENLLIKQSCRFFAYKFEMGPMQTDDPADIYSLKFLKLLYDKPDEHINKLLCCPSLLNDIDKKHETVDNDNLTITNKLILLNYLKKVNDMRSIPAKLWADLQHYLCYMYRYCMTTNPEPEQEILSQSFLSEVRTLICGLMQDDEIQLCLRLFSLVREYTIFAHAQHQKIPTVEASIESLFYYYEAFLSATKNICRIFPELEKLLLNTYKLGWLDFNSSIFMYYFYETPYVQNMVKQFELMKDNVSIKAAGIYTVLTELHKLWRSQMLGINGIITSKIGTKFRNSDNKSMAAYKKILSTNFWIDRTQEEKSQHDTKLFDYQLFVLVGDKNLILPEPILDENGHCICEDCLVIKYTSLLKNQQIKLPIERMRVSCQFCKEIIDLDHFILHVNGRYSSKMDTNKCENPPNLSKSLQDNNDSVKLGMTANSRNVNKNEDNNDDDNCVNNVKNPSPKLASEPPTCTSIQQNGDKKAQDNNAKMSRKTFINLLKHSENVEKATGPNPCNNSNKNSGVTFPCGHSCKLEEELKSEFKKAYQETCDHHKESKKCDCTFCEVFGTSSHIHKTNETRNRLRIRLNQRNEKIDNKTTDKTNLKTNVSQPNKNSTNKTESTVVTTSKMRNQSPEIFQPISFDSEQVHPITNDIHRLLSFIEGNLTTDKVALAEKKAAKKARQRLRKEQEKLKLEEEEKKRAEEEKRKQEERLRNEELEKQQAEKASKKELKKKKQKLKKETNNELIEETIPAIVTIKRVIENDNSTPTVTITLKGSTPDQDKLLYTLVNGDNDEKSSNNSSSNNNYNNTISDKKNKKTKSQSSERTISLELNCNNSNKKISSNNENVINNNNTNNNSNNNSSSNNNNNSSSCGKKKKNKSDINCQSPKNIITKEVKVTLAVDSCNINNDDDTKSKAAVSNSAKLETNTKNKKQSDKKNKKNKESDINIPMLKLPPGITITKVDGPMSERNYKTTNNENHSFNSNIPVNKSGVILVDTEKLIKQSGLTSSSSSSSSKSTINSLTQSHSKKNKKKKNKKQETINQTNNKTEKQMVTLKNPIFQNIQTKRNDKDVIQDTNNGNCQQAAIFKNENGMVTIRSSRLQQSLTNGTPVTNFVSDLKPVLGPDVATPYMSTCNLSDTTTKISSFNAQEILSGLPGIEITKVDKHSNKIDNDNKKSCQTAEVSIIPANNNNNNNINNYVDKFNFDKDDLLYDNVFTPKDILEDDMDAEELELEAFKRFCQQSIPPKRKEKVAHLNVKDIVLKKKNDKISG